MSTSPEPDNRAVTCLPQAGFTLVELIVVILLVGILAAYAVPRLDLAGYRSAGFYQQTLAAVRFAQKQAINTGCSVEVEINTLDAEICELKWNGCAGNANLAHPATGNMDFCANSAPAGAVPSVSFSFDRIGAPTAAQSFSIDGRTLVVEANTGFAHE